MKKSRTIKHLDAIRAMFGPSGPGIDILGKWVYRPYRRGTGMPVFVLYLYDLNVRQGAQHLLGYALEQVDPSGKKRRTTIFRGADFGSSPMHAVDSPETRKALMGFLCLRPGDTDREYFDDYTEVQWDFANLHAETLGALFYE